MGNPSFDKNLPLKSRTEAENNILAHEKQHDYNINVEPIISGSNTPTGLQQHILFWDRDNDNIIYPQDVFNGFRDLGFSIPFSILSLLIPIYFSYPTRLAHSWFPDPLFRIYVSSIHKAKHGSDTGVYDLDGNLSEERFEMMFDQFDSDRVGGLGVKDLVNLVAKDRVAMDFAGWTFAYMEWSTTWLLLQREGRVWKDDLRQAYDGTLFWRIREERINGNGWRQGFGWKEFFQLVVEFPKLLSVVSLTVALFAAIGIVRLKMHQE